MLTTSPSLVHHVVTAQDILNAAGTVLELDMHDSEEITLAIGFTVWLSFDNGEPLSQDSQTTRVGAGGESPYSRYPVGVYRVRRGPTSVVRLTFPPGDTANVEEDQWRRPQLVVVDGCRGPSQLEPVAPNLFALPFKTAEIVPAGTPFGIGTREFNVTLGEPSPFEVATGAAGARSPSEIWIACMSAMRTIFASGLPSGQALYTVAIYSIPGPAQDGIFRHFSDAAVPSAFMSARLGAPHRMNLKACYDDWPAAGDGGVQLSCQGAVGVTPDTVRIRIGYYYRM